MKHWLDFHCVDAELIQDIIAAYRSFGLSAALPNFADIVPNYAYSALPNLSLAYEKLIMPAFDSAFSPEISATDLLSSVIFQPLTDNAKNTPHTVDTGKDQSPVIVMGWQGTPDDLICLAHEAAHALQIHLSDHVLMPPVARETCAFLGELILIDYMYQNDKAIFNALSQVWHNENEIYLGDDMDVLSIALQNPEEKYHYRQNYPIARLAAAQIYRGSRHDKLISIFSSGKDAMAYLPLENMANKAGEFSNYLPPLSPARRDDPAINAYRALGAMTLLEIDYWQGETEIRISDYYTKAFDHLQNHTAFIALNDLRKPVGYATWCKTSSSNKVLLTRQVAPFGDYLTLQKAVEQYLQPSGSVFAQHYRSARKEQTAW